MSDATDLQHHLEEGLLLFSRGLVFEARESWRKALQIEPTNPVGQDYLSSTDCELNPYDRQREAEALKANRPMVRPRVGTWEEDEYEVIAAGPDDDEEPLSGDDGGASGFVMAEADDDDGEQGATGWVSVPDEEGEWQEEVPGGWSVEDGLRPDGVEVLEAGSDEDDEEAYGEDAAAAEGDRIEAAEAEQIEAAEADDDQIDAAEIYQERIEVVGSGAAADGARGNVEPRVAAGAGGGAHRAERTSAAGSRPSAEKAGTSSPSRADAGDEWEPLDWINEDTPVVPAQPARGAGKKGRAVSQADSIRFEAGSAAIADGGSSQMMPSEPAAPTQGGTVEDEVETLMAEAGHELLEGHRDAARILLQRVLAIDPGHVTAQQYLTRVDKELLAHYERTLGASDGVPVLKRPQEELFALDLDPAGGYILSCIDGAVTLDDIYTLSAHLDKLTMMRILVELIESGVVSIRR